MNQIYGRITVIVDDQKLEVSIEDVGPERAQEFLSSNSQNRPLKRELIANLAMNMTEGTFRFNGDTLRQDLHGNLADAQHRCHAIIKSGVTVPMLIIRGFDPTVMDTIDQGVSRTVVDILKTHGVDVPNMSLITSVGAILLQGNRSERAHGRDRARVAEYVEKNLTEFIDICTWAKRLSRNSKVTTATRFGRNTHCLSPSPLAALRIHMVRSGADEDSVTDFFEKLAEIRRTESDAEYSSFNVVRNWLARAHPLVRDGGMQFPVMLGVYAILIHAYNRITAGEAIFKMRTYETGYRYLTDLPAPEL